MKPPGWRPSRLLTAALVIAVIICTMVAGKRRLEGYAKPYDKVDIIMDTVVRITAFGPNAPKATEEAFARMKRIDFLMNPYEEGSDLSRINNAAGKTPIKVDPETVRVVKEAVRYAALTDGAFDPTIWPLIRLWGIGSGNETVPAQADIRRALDLVNFRDIGIDETQNTVFLERPGMGIDLGGIAKGYAVQVAADVLREQGVKSALINAGGNVYALGTRTDGTPWRIGIQHPRRLDDYIARVEIVDGTAVTSGDYQRYFEAGGKRYHHILDPKTGMPAEGLMSITIFGKSSLDCDALSTSAFVLGLKKGMELIESLGGLEAFAVDEDGGTHFTSGLKGNIEVYR